jgi:hypothetical protein
MATPGQLVQTTATVLGLPVATVTQYDRQLAESGLRSKGGRGTSAATVTARDAANLLIAIVAAPLAGPTVKEAVQTCEIYGSLKEVRGPSWTDRLPKFGLRTLASLPHGHSLREALSILIDGVGKGEIFQVPDREGPLTADFCFGIRFGGPAPWAEILADGSVGEGKTAQMARLVYNTRSTSKHPRGPRTAPRGDLHQSRSITFATVRALGSLISEAR